MLLIALKFPHTPEKSFSFLIEINIWATISFSRQVYDIVPIGQYL